jgi:hypothetical protein
MFLVVYDDDERFRTLWPNGEHPVRHLSAEDHAVAG